MGRIRDWSISRKNRDRVNVPIYLAGSLNKNETILVGLLKSFTRQEINFLEPIV
ncbi:hypothetical protein [Hydrococcus rivularis]|uniref:hypothetical protein n=1 Tax=Hydrococcus rivularis TaxID=1616834 RepID=UPI000A6741D3|nr:hypothetical protein [Hydrococcus rivularis]